MIEDADNREGQPHPTEAIRLLEAFRKIANPKQRLEIIELAEKFLSQSQKDGITKSAGKT